MLYGGLKLALIMISERRVSDTVYEICIQILSKLMAGLRGGWEIIQMYLKQMWPFMTDMCCSYKIQLEQKQLK